jgi:hypothetical protein
LNLASAAPIDSTSPSRSKAVEEPLPAPLLLNFLPGTLPGAVVLLR